MIDRAGNLNVGGPFVDTAHFDKIVAYPAGNGDMFVAKYLPDCTPVRVISAGGPYWDSFGSSTVDDSGNTYMAGNFERGIS